MNTQSKLTKDILENLYLHEKRSCRAIGIISGISTKQVSRYLQRFGIKARPFSTKGLQPNLGKHLSEETKDKIRQKHIGKKLSEVTKLKIKQWMISNKPFLGRHHTEKSKQIQREKMKGRKLTPEHRAKVIKSLIWGDVKGEKSHGWKGGISSINARIRSSKEFIEWRDKVKERDKYICVWCGFYSKSNHADHIAPFAYFPELRFSVDNGRTLCVKCHRKTDTYGNKNLNKK